MKQATITGKLGADPTVKYFESGKVKTTFSLATSGWDSKKKEKRTNWFDVEVWEKQAEFAGEHFKKGMTVTVQGDIVAEPYKEKIYWKIKNTTAKYDQSLITVSGIIEKTETRFSAENKKIQILKLKDIDFPVYLQHETDVFEGEYKAFFCTLEMVDYQPLVRVIRSDLAKQEQTTADTGLSKEELDEIPF